MHGFSTYAPHAASMPLCVFADKSAGAQDYDHSNSLAHPISRFGGLKLIRRRQKAQAIKSLCQQGRLRAIFADSWKSIEHLGSDLNVPIICFAHGNEFPQNGKKDARIARALTRANQIIAVSRPTLERVKRLTAMHDHIHLIHPPIDIAPTLTKSAEQDMDTLWPVRGPASQEASGQACRLLCLSRLIDWKGIDTSIKALHRLLSEGMKAHLMIAGDGPQENELRNLVAQYNMETHVDFIGRIEGEAKYALFKSADIFMQPGRRIGDQCEGFGITYLEAAQMGCPSISGCEGGAVDAVDHGKTGLVIDGTSIDQVADAVKRLVKDTSLYKSMSDNAKIKADNALWSHKIYEMIDLIQEGQR